MSSEPASRLIDVEEGAGVEVEIIGRRVSYSCFGVVHSLAMHPVGGVSVTARGLENCSDTHEASTSEADGTFRLRGLPPYCSFLVEVLRPGGRRESGAGELHGQGGERRRAQREPDRLPGKPTDGGQRLHSQRSTFPPVAARAALLRARLRHAPADYQHWQPSVFPPGTAGHRPVQVSPHP